MLQATLVALPGSRKWLKSSAKMLPASIRPARKPSRARRPFKPYHTIAGAKPAPDHLSVKIHSSGGRRCRPEKQEEEEEEAEDGFKQSRAGFFRKHTHNIRLAVNSRRGPIGPTSPDG